MRVRHARSAPSSSAPSPACWSSGASSSSTSSRSTIRSAPSASTASTAPGACIAVGLFSDGSYGQGWNGVGATDYLGRRRRKGVTGLFYGDAQAAHRAGRSRSASASRWNVVVGGVVFYVIGKLARLEPRLRPRSRSPASTCPRWASRATPSSSDQPGRRPEPSIARRRGRRRPSRAARQLPPRSSLGRVTVGLRRMPHRSHTPALGGRSRSSLYLLLIAVLPLFVGRFWEQQPQQARARARSPALPVVVYLARRPPARRRRCSSRPAREYVVVHGAARRAVRDLRRHLPARLAGRHAGGQHRASWPSVRSWRA